MDARESLAKRNHRDVDFWDHVRADQWSAAQNSAVESARSCFAGIGVDGFNRGDDAGARIQCSQLRHPGSVARNDADIGVSLSRAFFRMGSRCCSALFAHTAAAVALSDTYLGHPFCAARERYDLSAAGAARRCGIRRGKLPLLPYLIALATSANIGSVATLVGNPQNMIIEHFSRIPFAQFSGSLAPAAVVGVAINFGIVSFGFRNVLRAALINREPHAVPNLDRGLFAIVCAVLISIFVCFVAGLNLAWTALAGAVLVMVIARRDTHEVLKLVDWHLLVFFAALFVVVDGLNDTGLPDAIYRHLQPMFGSHATVQAWNLTWFSVAGSNIFSNVPFVLVAGKWIPHFIDPALMWKVLALATTFAGNLTIIGSVANMIVVESAREHLQVGFWDYARFGIPITILTTSAGTVVLLVLH